MDTPEQRAATVEMIVCDVDGVLTDGGIIYGPDGLEMKRFDVQDGMGITLAKAAGLTVCAITGRTSDAAGRRLDELGFDCVLQSCPDKMAGYRHLKDRFRLDDERIAFVGDDLQDLPVFACAGLPCAVANTIVEAKKFARYTSSRMGGHGAVREIIDWILTCKNLKERAIARVLADTASSRNKRSDNGILC